MKPTFSSIEALESRIAPAALTAKLLGSVLKVVGDPATATVTITQTGGLIEVLDGATSLGLFTGVKMIDSSILGGATVNLSLAGSGLPGACKIAATGATTVIVSSGSHLDGGLTFTGDVAAQTLSLQDDVTVGKGLMFKGGEGADTITIGNGGTIGGNLMLMSVESGSFTANSVATAIAGSLRVINTGDLLPATIQTTNTAGLSISGGVSYAGGTVSNSLFLLAAITKGATFLDLTGDNGFGFGSGSVIHGSVAMTSGVGADGFNFQGGMIDGNLTLKLGSGNNSFYYGIAGAVTIGGKLSITTGSGDDLWQGSGGGMTVGKDVAVNLGDGTNTINVGLTVSGTKLSITTGSGADTIGLYGMATNVAAIIALGASNDSLTGSLLGTLKKADFNGGAGMDHLSENTFVADPIVIRSFEDFT